MKEKKLQVFVSSTYNDLKEERQAAVEAILSSGNIPAGMELFTAGDETQMIVIKRWIEESDVYLLILGGRYGSIEKNSGKSYTHLEYEYALSINKPLFAVVITDKALDIKAKDSDWRSVIERDNPKLLDEFRNQVLKNLVKFWEDSKDIKLAIHETLNEFSNTRKNLVGWVRGNQSINAGLLAEEIARLTKRNSELEEKITESKVNALYNGVTYQEMANLLKHTNIGTNGIARNLLEQLVLDGEALSSHYGLFVDPKNQNIISDLRKFKLVKNRDSQHVIFTDDGHDFYIKTIALNHYSNSINKFLNEGN